MLSRRLWTAVAALGASIAVIAFAPPPPGLTAPPDGGSAPRATEEFALDLVEGELVIRDAEEPYALTNPTSIEGTNTDGAIIGGSFTTPSVSLRQDISSPIDATVFIDADFAQVTPSSAFGTIDHLGRMVVRSSLSVDLHVDVQPPGGGTTIMSADCRTSPVNLTFETVEPYTDPDGPDGSEPGRVTLADADFSIPEMVVEEPCNPLVSGEINNQLAGPGHAIILTLEGAITLPPPPGCPTSLTLAASPAGEAVLGAPVALTATVTPEATHELCLAAEADGQVPGGFVDFHDGPTLLGTAGVGPGATATLTTSTIQAGTRSLTATYRRAFPFDGSTTVDAIEYRITPDPTITANLPEFVTIGADPTEFEVTVANSNFGSNLERGRLDITLSRSTADISESRVLVEYLDDQTWIPIDLTPANAPGTTNLTLWGSVGEPTGFPLSPGTEQRQRLRIKFLTTGGTPSPASCSALNETCPGFVNVAVELIGVDSLGAPAAMAAPSPDAAAASSGQIMLTETVRRPSTLTLNIPAAGGPITPHSVRQGGTVSMSNIQVGPVIAGRRPTGYLEFLLDGQVLGVRKISGGNASPEAAPLTRVTLGVGNTTVAFDLPTTIALGVHQVTARYSGDAVLLPIQASSTLTVFEAKGTALDCLAPFQTNTRFRAYVEAQANLPGVRPSGSGVDLAGFTMRMFFSRDPSSQNNARNSIAPANSTRAVGANLSIELGFGEGGTGTAASITRSNGIFLVSTPNPAAEANVDEVMLFNSPSGSVSIAGEPGALAPIELNFIKLTGVDTLGVPHPVTCTPLGQGHRLGEVLVSGNTLSVEPKGPVRVGEQVTLTSAVEPYTTGQIEFLDGDQTIGVAPVVDGVASMVTTSLPAGVRNLRAIHTAGMLVPPLVSNTVELEVVATECEAFAVDGHGATVRLVYLELLGRCPDQAGFDYWVDRLEDGLSSEAFARIIAATPEAVGRVVDDAYRTMLGRSADASGRVFWTGQLSAHGRYDRLLADLGASDEFWTLAGATNEGFVTRVYERLLNRAPEQSGLDYWVGRLDAGTSRRALILSLANLDEPLGVLVADSYDEILDRAPTAGERADGIDHLRATGDRSGLYAELIGRPEFEDRAQEFPNTEG